MCIFVMAHFLCTLFFISLKVVKTFFMYIIVCVVIEKNCVRASHFITYVLLILFIVLLDDLVFKLFRKSKMEKNTKSNFAGGHHLSKLCL